MRPEQKQASKSEERYYITDYTFDRKVELATTGLGQCYLTLLKNKVCKDNGLAISRYILAMKSELNLSDNTRASIIKILTKLSRSSCDITRVDVKYSNSSDLGFSVPNNQKRFEQISREDIIQCLDSLRKKENEDPLHRWIGTYNLYRIHIIKFFKWFYSPDIPHKARPKPSIIENIPQLKRKEQSIYKPSDLWTEEDDLLFFKYCPNKRDRCYHAISKDTAARPHEILKVKIKTLSFKTAGNYQYAEILVNGKTGTRTLPLINSIPYVKDWLDEHPQRANPNAPLICGAGKSLGRHIKPETIWYIYTRYKSEVFPKLLEDPDVPQEDKRMIMNLLNKPWNPYIRRHSALNFQFPK